MASPISDTDPDMPAMVPVEQELADPSKFSDLQKYAPDCGCGRRCGRDRNVCLKASSAVPNLPQTPKDMEDEEKLIALRTSIIANRLQESERSKANRVSQGWRVEDSEFQPKAHSLDAEEQAKMITPREVRTIPGGLSGTTATSCARAGCEKPSRGTGGTSKYCSRACMDADDSDEEEVEPVPVSTHTGVRRGYGASQAVDIAMSDGKQADMETFEKLGSANQANTRAMSLEGFEANYVSGLPFSTLIFLDVDGVLNSTGDGDLGSDEVITSATPMMILNRSCLQRLVKLVRDTNARLVLSSTWRSSTDLKTELLESLVAEGLPRDAFIGQTPVIAFSLRHYEIKEWLADKRTAEVNVPWVVLDDMQLGSCAELKGHFVWVDPAIGLSDDNLEKASSILLSCVPC